MLSIDGPSDHDITRLLRELRTGGPTADERLIRAVYKDLRRLAASYLRKEGDDESLQPTELVNEAYLGLADKDKVAWQNRSHFFAVSAKIMRHILVDRARARLAAKRGDGLQRVELEETLLAAPVTSIQALSVHEALERFEKISPRQAQIIELRYFGGRSNAEIAEILGIADRTVKRDVASALAWFFRELQPSNRRSPKAGGFASQ
ncbi:ECF-type sigma factor [Granulicella sp. dw_53]|uniref:ECF-type sigma factor n=1 Tax=Granulicella sp. dw_53 TaxID=2719792 RepID=UPI001BD28C88|nr:ECF-type sigma factor [Granulicella sp. dw_53]